MFEIFVYSPRFEGVHLRGGKVARGGLRWSDRPEDFRTEVLGPRQGADGEEHGHRAGRLEGRLRAEARAGGRGPRGVPGGGRGLLPGLPARACSTSPTTSSASKHRRRRRRSCATMRTTRISSSPPTRARRRSPTSPTRSAREYGFWLGDAFASGGSAGYDHKEMGITARGAWEAVKRHFREMGVDTQTTDFTVVGIGDMSGDVFGNGMLLSRHIRLRRGVRPPPHLPRSRTPTRRRASPSASACSGCRARRGPTTTRR